NRTNDKGDRREGHRGNDAGLRVIDLEAVGLKKLPIPPGLRKERHEHKASHGSRKREGQVNKRVEQTTPGKPVTGQDPGEQKADKPVENGGDGGGAESDPISSQRPIGADDAPEFGKAHARNLEQHGAKRQQDDQRDVKERYAHGQPEAGQQMFAAGFSHGVVARYSLGDKEIA